MSVTMVGTNAVVVVMHLKEIAASFGDSKAEEEHSSLGRMGNACTGYKNLRKGSAS